MKSITLLAALFFAGTAFAEYNVTISDSKIDTVTVYQDRARVSRTSRIALEPGKTVLSFEKLPTTLEGKSLRAKLANTSVKLLGISWERITTNTIENSTLSKLEKEKEALLDEDTILADKENMLESEKRQIQAYYNYARKVMSEQATKAVSTAANWNESIAFLDKRTIECDAEQSLIAQQRNKLDNKISVLDGELSKYLSPDSRTTYTAYVTVETPSKTSSQVTLSYVSYGAQWTPRYDARISTSTNQIEFIYGADVHQRTGEKWEDVKLRLSTAQPQISAIPPQPQTLWMTSYKRQTKAKPKVKMKTVELDEVAMGAVPEAIPLTDSIAPVDDIVAVEDHGLSVSFAISAKATIPADNRPYQVEVTKLNYPATLTFETIPKLRPYVYMKGKTKNDSSYPFLPGPVTIFRNGSYIGSSSIEFTAAQAPVELFAGIDENIQVRRQKVKQKQHDRKMFSSTAEKRYIWETLVVNNSKNKETVSLIDSIPISEVEEVEIRINGETSKGYTFDRKTGKLTWKLTLPARSTKKIILAYSVEK